MKTKKIIKVLKFLQDTCRSRDDVKACYNCPFTDSLGGCAVRKTLPAHWNIGILERKFKDIETL